MLAGAKPRFHLVGELTSNTGDSRRCMKSTAELAGKCDVTDSKAFPVFGDI